MYLTFKSKHVLIDCHYQALEFLKSKCACLPNYRDFPRKNIIKLGVSSENTEVHFLIKGVIFYEILLFN